MTKSLHGAPRVALGLLLAACVSHTAASQTTSSSGIEEVIVTALKRDTSLQETPLSISAVYANNVFNKNAIVDSLASAISLGQNLVQSARPRTYGLNFRKSFTF